MSTLASTAAHETENDTMTGSVELTVLMPCLNEAETLARCIRKAQEWGRISGVAIEVLIADNGSSDGSQEIARGLCARVLNVPERGYGAALYHGSVAAAGRYVVMGDSDDSYDFSKLDLYITRLRDGYDLVMGNRFLGGIAPGAMPWKNRHIGNPVLSGIGRIFFGCPVSDFHCGMRGYSRTAFMAMDLRTTGMEFASEMVIKATLYQMRIAEVPTTLAKDGRSRPPHLRPWRDGWRHLRFMLLFSPRWLFIYPGAILLVSSLIAFFILYVGPVAIGRITFDVHSMLGAMAGAVLGYLALGLGLVARLIGVREGMLRSRGPWERDIVASAFEVGGALGIVLSFSGMVAGMAAVTTWGQLHFGPLASDQLIRQVALGLLLLLLGGVTLMVSLIIGFLSLPTRRVP